MIKRVEDFDLQERISETNRNEDSGDARGGRPQSVPAEPSAKSVRQLTKMLAPLQIGDLLRRWTDGSGGADPHAVTASRQQGAEWLREFADLAADVEVVERQVRELPEKLRGLLDEFVKAPGLMRSIADLAAHIGERFKSRYELEASVAALMREGLLYKVEAQPSAEPRSEHRVGGFAARSTVSAAWAVPIEIATALTDAGGRRQRELRATVSMLGHLEDRVRRNHEAERPDPDRAERQTRRIYKLYLLDSSLRTRIDALPEDVRAVFERAVDSWGGIMPVQELERLQEEGEGADVDLVRKSFEEGVLGTVAALPTARFGIENLDRAVVVFQEVVIAVQRMRATDLTSQIDAVVSSGVDLCSNVTRFLREVETSKVQFTAEGSIYKASAKRIGKGMLALPGGFLPVDPMLRFIYRVCLSRRLVERSGERALKLSEAGYEFEQLPLHEKVRALVGHAVEEKSPHLEPFHQARQRRILLKLLRRCDEAEWHDLMSLPLLARNAYLVRLHEMRAEEHFAGRFKRGGYRPSESVHKLALSLADFIKRRLYPLGLVDLGVVDGRPIAFRLTRMGAELLGGETQEERVGGVRSTVVVNPDFELILFPGDDEHEVVHRFDRFAEREKSDHVHHFRLTLDSVRAGLADGLSLAEIRHELTDRSRAPLPQSVLFSLEDWGARSGVLLVDGEGRLKAGRSELLDRFMRLPQVASRGVERVSATEARMGEVNGLDAIAPALRDHGFLLERA